MSNINFNSDVNSVYFSSYSNNEKKLNLNSNSEDVSIFATNSIEESSESLREELQNVQDEQGIIGKAWNGFKNLIGIGVGSNKVEDKIEAYENGEISYDEALEYIESYEAKQEGMVDLGANLVSGVVTGAITVASGGTLTAAGLAAGAAIGGALKAGIKTVDRATNNVEGDALDAKQITKDVITGAVDGALNVATAGMVKGAAAGKTVKEAAIQGIKTGAKAGAISGAGAGVASYTADVITEEDVEFNLKDLVSSTAQNAIGGAVMGGIMGGVSQGFAQNKLNKTLGTTGNGGPKPEDTEAPKPKSGNSEAGDAPEVKTGDTPDSKPVQDGDTKPLQGADDVRTGDTPDVEGKKATTQSPEDVKPSDTSEIRLEEAGAAEEVKPTDTQSPVKKVTAKQKVLPQAPDDYSDTKAFSEYFEQRLKTQLSAKSEADINKMIQEIAQQTGVSEHEAAETLAKLTQFTSYSQMPELSDKLQKLGIGEIYCTDGDGISLNKVMKYIAEGKEQIQLSNSLGSSKGFFLDEQGLSYLSSLDDTAKASFLSKVKSGEVKLVAVDGWNVNSGADGSYLSYGMFGQDEELSSLATRVIRQAQSKGADVSTYLETLNDGIQSKARSILGSDVDVAIIHNNNAMQSFRLDGTGKSISETMAPKCPTSKEIATAIDAIVDTKMPGASADELSEARGLLARYYDEMFTGYSAENLTEEMVSKYAAIQSQVEALGKTMDDVVYLIPTEFKNDIKSFDLLLYQYSKANGGIDPSQIIRYCSFDPTPTIESGKIAVVLDDIVGSGNTMVGEQFGYNTFKQVNPDTEVLFTPLCSLQQGVDKISNAIQANGGQDILMDCVTVNYNSNMGTTLTQEQMSILSKLLGEKGWKSGSACTAMPYMLPDNNSDASSAMLQFFLNSQKGNKMYGNELTLLVEQLVKNGGK